MSLGAVYGTTDRPRGGQTRLWLSIHAALGKGGVRSLAEISLPDHSHEVLETLNNNAHSDALLKPPLSTA